MIDFVEAVNDMHERMLKGILEQILKRPAVPSDAARLTIVYDSCEGVLGPRTLLFDNVKIGTYTTKVEDTSITTTFVPDASFQ